MASVIHHEARGPRPPAALAATRGGKHVRREHLPHMASAIHHAARGPRPPAALAATRGGKYVAQPTTPGDGHHKGQAPPAEPRPENGRVGEVFRAASMPIASSAPMAVMLGCKE